MRAFSPTPWLWIPSLYYTQGIPNAFIMFVFQVMILAINPKIQLAELTFWTGLLALPWSFKFLWAPILDLIGKKKNWIIFTQYAMGVLFFASAFLLPFQVSTQWLIGLFLAFGFVSATCDIASDGYYMLVLSESQQAFFSGIRSTFFRIANITIRGGLILVASYCEKQFTISSYYAWAITLGIMGAFFIIIALYHGKVLTVDTSDPMETKKTSFMENIKSFLYKKNIIALIIFIFLYRFAEAQLGAITTPFLMGAPDLGGLGLASNEIGIIYGVFGVIAMLIGGILGGFLISRFGLGKLLWPMVIALNLPDLLYLFMAVIQPMNRVLITSFIMIEQFGYGFGFASFMLILVYFADNSGKYRTSHYAFLSGMMVASTILPTMISGKLAASLGYSGFFLWVNIATVFSFISVIIIANKINPLFGKKESKNLNKSI